MKKIYIRQKYLVRVVLIILRVVISIICLFWTLVDVVRFRDFEPIPEGIPVAYTIEEIDDYILNMYINDKTNSYWLVARSRKSNKENNAVIYMIKMGNI